VKVTPDGSDPDRVNVGSGNPLVVTMALPADPTTNVVEAMLVIAGDCATVNVNACVSGLPLPFAAVTDNGYAPASAGAPLSVAVPSPLSVAVTPAGSAPVTTSVGTGNPAAVTVKLPADPKENVVAAALVIATVCVTVNVNACAAGAPTPLVAVIVSG
jgi:hypothetical protein